MGTKNKSIVVWEQDQDYFYETDTPSCRRHHYPEFATL